MGDLSTLGGRMRHVRLKRGFSQKEIGIASGEVTSQAVTAWEANINRPGIDALLGFQKKTGCDLHWLLTGENIRGDLVTPGFMPGHREDDGGRYVPMLTNEEIQKLPQLTTNEILEDRGERSELYLTKFPCSGQAFWARIQDNANAPRFERGDWVVIDPAITPQPNDMVLVRDEESQQLFFGIYRPRRLSSEPGVEFDLEFHAQGWPPLKWGDMKKPILLGTMSEHSQPRKI